MLLVLFMLLNFLFISFRLGGSSHSECNKMSETKPPQEDDSPQLNPGMVSEEDDNLSDMGSHTGSERDAPSEAGSETPSISDRSSQRNSRSTSNTPTNMRSTRSRDNPDFLAKQKSFMAKVHAATSGNDTDMMRPETPVKRKRDSSASSGQGPKKKRKTGKVDNNGQVSKSIIHDIVSEKPAVSSCYNTCSS